MIDYNPHELNIQFDIQIRTIDNTTGEDVEAWATAYSGVWGRRLAPPRGSESDEANQNVSIQRDSFKIRDEGRTITAKNHRIVMGSEKFYIENIRPFKSSLDYLVLDTEKRDNDVGSDPITSLSLANADQTKSSGAAIDTVTATTDQDAVFFTTDLPAGCTLTTTSSTTATVTGTAPASTAQFTITALGVDGGLYSKTVDITVSAATPISSLTYSNDDQTIYAESGTGSFTTMTATVDPSGATGTYSSGDLPTGVALNSSTGDITISNFSTLATGDNDFTVTFTGSGLYSGTANYEVTITKRELWVPDVDGFDVGSVVEIWRFDENVTSASRKVSAVAGANGNSLTQSTEDRKPMTTTLPNGKDAVVGTGDGGLGCATIGTVSTPFTIWVALIPAIQSNFFVYGGDSTNYLNFDSSERARVAINGTNIYISDDDSLKADISSRPTIIRNLHKSGQHEVELNATKLLSSAAASSDSFQGTIAVFDRDGASSTPGGNTMGVLAITSGNHSADDIEKMEGYLADYIGSQEYLPALHTYKSTPPFKALP